VDKARACGADILVTLGGASVGDHDLVQSTLVAAGMRLDFWKIAMRPGKPLMAGRLGNALFLGLPGNPVAVMVTFYQFARPALLRLAGVAPLPEQPLLQAACVTPIRKAPGRTEFLRGVLFVEDGEWKVRLTGAQGSGILSSMTDANCFIVLGPAQGSVAAGDPVAVPILDGIV